jgi:serine/threonine-protein kinase
LRSRQTIGGYQVLKILGQGSTSITYLVWRQGQNFVLKTLNSKRVNHPQARLLFEHEARILMQLNHPGMPRFLDFFSVMGQPYLVMEMIHGQTLFQQVAAQGVVSQAQAIAWLLEVCDVLEYLHASVPPMLHRDIKPSHLIRRVVPHAAQEIVLVDFGAVKVLALETDHSVAAGYMAPEQQQGQATPASDLYALGSTLIYLLTGQEPSLFYRQGEQGFRIYVEDVPELNPQVTAVIRTLTHPHPQQRYPSVKALATVLRQISL